ncbi:ribulose-phosphate 3-epimerase [soil metagenome]
MKLICPSILSANFSKLSSEIDEVVKAGAGMIHCDIMDGKFVPNISFGPFIVSTVRKLTSLPLDVHLMINEPQDFIDEFHEASADLISVHFENNIHLNRIVQQIKDKKMKAGVVLNPATSVDAIRDIVEYVDHVLLMSVNPGFGGQKFIPNVKRKIVELKSLLSKYNPKCAIEIDGGVGLDNIEELSALGVDWFVCGSSIFNTSDRAGVISKMKKLIDPAIIV